MPLRVLLFVTFSLIFFAACATFSPPPAEPETPDTSPPTVMPDSSAAEATPPDPVPETAQEEENEMMEETTEEMAETDSLAAPDPLYEATEEALRLAFTDGMFGLYRSETSPADAQRLGRAEIQTWLTDLALVSPRAVEFARSMLGPVLEQRFVVAFLLENAAQVECASVRDVLYVPVPERFQGPDRAFTGYIIQDACDISTGDLAPFCAGGFGTTDAGTSCSCTCTTGEAPAQPCVSC